MSCILLSDSQKDEVKDAMISETEKITPAGFITDIEDKTTTSSNTNEDF